MISDDSACPLCRFGRYFPTHLCTRGLGPVLAGLACCHILYGGHGTDPENAASAFGLVPGRSNWPRDMNMNKCFTLGVS